MHTRHFSQDICKSYDVSPVSSWRIVYLCFILCTITKCSGTAWFFCSCAVSVAAQPSPSFLPSISYRGVKFSLRDCLHIMDVFGAIQLLQSYSSPFPCVGAEEHVNVLLLYLFITEPYQSNQKSNFKVIASANAVNKTLSFLFILLGGK